MASATVPKETVYDEFALIERELQQCMRCGNCQAVCPVFITEKTEAGVARGKIALAQAIINGKLDLDDPDMYEHIFNCLLCKSCMQNCPPKVNLDKIILSLRSEIARKRGLHPLKRNIFNLLHKHKALFDLGMRAGGAFQGLFMRKTASGQGRTMRFPIGILDRKRVLPQLSATAFRDQVPEKILVKEPQTTVAFFTGCSINYIYPQFGHDIITVLKTNNVNIVIPKDQHCCGLAVFAHGDVATARDMARANLDALDASGAEHVITGCGSCGGTLVHEYKELLGDDPDYLCKVEYWSERVRDISTFLTKVIAYRKPTGEVTASVTYHDSCHLKKTMQVFAEPREIIRSIPGVTFKEMGKPDACCGSGGTYNLTHYETSTGILKRKTEDINKTGATMVVTGCPGCLIQLIDGIEQFGQGQRGTHYISLLAQSYRAEQKHGRKKH
ncbi:MAG TPA: (Fe-S)-binding protein [Dissulfurispiraceae bacterium]|nr:(Fe-S)-binding protein [Dissulfurispiraceae bacterium]